MVCQSSYRQSMEKFVHGSTDLDLFFTLSHNLPSGDTEKLNKLFATAFPKSAEEIECALKGLKYAGDKLNAKGYDFTSSFVPVLRCARTGAILASAVVVEKKITKKSSKGAPKTMVVHELVWMAAFSEVKGKGYGSRLFAEMHALSTRAQVAAILCESCDTALSYWLGITDVPISRTLVRDKIKKIDEEQSAEDKAALLWKESNPTNAARAEKLIQLLLPKEKGGVFTQSKFPPAALEPLYTDTVLRDRKGRIAESTVFQGAPYRYGTPEASHVWFPISSEIRGSLGKAELVIRKKQQQKKSRPAIVTDRIANMEPPTTPCTPFANFSLGLSDERTSGLGTDTADAQDAVKSKLEAEAADRASCLPDIQEDADAFGHSAALQKPKRKLSKQERQALERRRRAKLLAGEELSSDEDEEESCIAPAPVRGNKRMMARF